MNRARAWWRVWWPSVLGWPLSAACAFVGAYLAPVYYNLAIYLGVACWCAFGAQFLYLRAKSATRRTHTELARMSATETRAVNAGHTAALVRLLVIGRDGTLFAGTLLELIEQRPTLGVHVWDDPYFVRVFYDVQTAEGESCPTWPKP